jgi:hypothetical protein
VFEIVVGTQNADGVGLKGDYHGLRIIGSRSPHDLFNDMTMRTVYAVEIADADHGWTKVTRHVVEIVERSHGKLLRRLLSLVVSRSSPVVSEERLLRSRQ